MPNEDAHPWFEAQSQLPLHPGLITPSLLLPITIERGENAHIIRESVPRLCPYFGTIDGHFESSGQSDHVHHCHHLYNNPSFYNRDLSKMVSAPPTLLGQLPWKLYDNSRNENKMWLQDFNAQSSSNCRSVGFQLPPLPHIPSPSHINPYHHHSRVGYTHTLTREEDTSWFELSWRKSSLLDDPGGIGYEGTCSLHSVTSLHSINANCAPVLSYSPPPSQMMIGCGTSASLFYMGPTPNDFQSGQPPPPLAVVSGQCRECSVGCMDWTTCGCRFLPGSNRNAGCFFTLCGATERLAHLFTGLFAS